MPAAMVPPAIERELTYMATKKSKPVRTVSRPVRVSRPAPIVAPAPAPVPFVWTQNKALGAIFGMVGVALFCGFIAPRAESKAAPAAPAAPVTMTLSLDAASLAALRGVTTALESRPAAPIVAAPAKAAPAKVAHKRHHVKQAAPAPSKVRTVYVYVQRIFWM
jgi:hypothetical protein